MRTSLNEIKLIDMHIFRAATPADALLFDAMLILNHGLDERVMWQKKAHEIIVQYSRKQLKAEITAVHTTLFAKPGHRSFRHRIFGLFK